MLHVCVSRTPLLLWGISLSLQNKRCCPHLDIVSLSLPRLAIDISPRLAWHCLMWCHQIWHHCRFNTTTFTQRNFAPNRLGALACHALKCDVTKSDITKIRHNNMGPAKLPPTSTRCCHLNYNLVWRWHHQLGKITSIQWYEVFLFLDYAFEDCFSIFKMLDILQKIPWQLFIQNEN